MRWPASTPFGRISHIVCAVIQGQVWCLDTVLSMKMEEDLWIYSHKRHCYWTLREIPCFLCCRSKHIWSGFFCCTIHIGPEPPCFSRWFVRFIYLFVCWFSREIVLVSKGELFGRSDRLQNSFPSTCLTCPGHTTFNNFRLHFEVATGFKLLILHYQGR